MTIPFDYTDTRWDYPQGGIHKKTHRPFEACVVCGKPVYIDVPYLTIEVSWQNNEAMTPEDPREHSQGAFALGAGCLKNNPQLKPVVIKSDPLTGAEG